MIDRVIDFLVGLALAVLCVAVGAAGILLALGGLGWL